MLLAYMLPIAMLAEEMAHPLDYLIETLHFPDVLGGVVSGSGTLNISGAGFVTLSGANTYTGGTLLPGTGTLNINNATAIGTGLMVLGNGTIDNGTGSRPASRASRTNRSL